MKHILYVAVIAILLTACHNGENKQAVTIEDMTLTEADQNKAENAADTAIPSANRSPFIAPNEHQDWGKKIIKTAKISLELQNYAAYNTTLHRSLRSYGAYIAAEEQRFTDERLENQVTVKVPVERFEALINSFAGEGIKVLEKKISTEEVTGEIIDTKSRIEAKKQVRDRYLLLLKHAKNMKDILQVQQEINNIQEEIESADGRVAYLGHQSAYSTIHLSFFQPVAGNELTADRNSFTFKIKNAFSNSISVISNLLVIIVTLWPLILIVFIGLLVWKNRKARIQIVKAK